MPAKGYRCENPKYATVHIWIRKERGKPDQYPCEFCGGKAKEWACIRNKTLSENRASGFVTYSDNVYDYVPACRSCNCKLDKPAQELCKNGHNDWIPNKNTTHNKRHCRTCRNERQRKYRRKS